MQLLLLFALAAIAGCKDPIEVEPDEGTGQEGMDLSGTDLTAMFCQSVDLECQGKDIEVKFAISIDQCKARCIRKLRCLNVWYDEERTCHLRKSRCKVRQLRNNGIGMNLHRLKKGEECTEERPSFVGDQRNFDRRFCLMEDKSCPGYNLYKKPQKFPSAMACLKKCIRIKSCAMIDYKSGECELKDTICGDDALAESPGTGNYLRLEVGQSCSPDREEAGPEPTSTTTTTTTTTTAEPTTTTTTTTTTTPAPTTTTTTTTTPAPTTTTTTVPYNTDGSCGGKWFHYCKKHQAMCWWHDLPYLGYHEANIGEDECARRCSRDCNCRAYQYTKFVFFWNVTWKCFRKSISCDHAPYLGSSTVGVKREVGQSC